MAGEAKPDPFVAKLLQHAEAGSGLATLIGILGASPRGDEFWRLYLTLQFDEYVDIHKRDVIGTRPVPEDRSPLQRVAVWIPAVADVYYTRVDARTLQASFLQGAIANDHAPQPGEGNVGDQGGVFRLTYDAGCSTKSTGCIVVTRGC